MSIYKGVEVPDHLPDLLVHMREVGAYCEELAALGQHWDLLSILGQMSGGATDMGRTREGFKRLTSELLTQLGTETLKKSVQQLTSKAQVAVDIVIRNLFERTADIGFLATDDDVRRFLTERSDAHALIARFKEYVAKYSVYHDIILLDTDGRVLAHIDETTTVEQSADPLVQEALTTQSAYVEAFRHVDLLPHQQTSLVYAYRVTESNNPRSRALGVLCLCFRFENEMEGVFRNLTEEGDWSVLTLLDRQGRVISTSDAHQIPLGATMPLVVDQPYRVIRFAGRQYLAKTCATHGYQGYMGPGWYGHALAPLEHVFECNTSRPAVQIEPHVLDAVTRNQQLFAAELQRIPADAEVVQQQLDRAVWNGNIRRDERADGVGESAVKVLLWEISKTGGRTRNVFERSIGNLHGTVTSSLLSDAEFLASLAIDIMDRNLYERANDCRWWALTTTFRERLARDTGASRNAEIAAILAYINGLYTVYANLFVYDRQGDILAVSNPRHQQLVGTTRRESWIGATLSLTSSQQYTVSPFEATDLYDGQATYVYGAAIAEPGLGSRAVGGIGIVFDGRPQFEAMLRDSLPRSAGGDIIEGAFGAFVSDQRVVSSTSSELAIGEVLDVDRDLLSLAPGQGTSRVIEWHGQYYVVGARASSGYREYKGGSDGYRNAVTSFIFIPLGRSGRAMGRRSSTAAISVRADRRLGKVVELATFYIGGQWMGMRSESIVEALGVEHVTSLPVANPTVAGLTHFRGKPIPVLAPQGRSHERRAGAQMQVVVVQTASGHMGIIVDELGEIPEVAADRVEPIPAVVDQGSYVEGVVRPDVGEQWPCLLLLVDGPKLCSTLMAGNAGEVMAEVARLAAELNREQGDLAA